MTKFRAGDRVYHIRRGDSIAQEGFGILIEIEGTRAKLLWEHNGKYGGVESRDLIAGDEAVYEGLT